MSDVSCPRNDRRGFCRDHQAACRRRISEDRTLLAVWLRQFRLRRHREIQRAELRKIFSDTGVKCESSHFDMKELRENLEERIAWAKDVGLTQMIVPSLNGPRNPTMDDVKRAADEYNRFGEQSAKAGIQQGLHNEGFELSRSDELSWVWEPIFSGLFGDITDDTKSTQSLLRSFAGLLQLRFELS